MKRFAFRLQRVLDFRTTEKKECERALAEKNYVLRQAEENLEGIIRAQDETEIPTQVVPMSEFMLTGNYQARLREALLQQRLLVIEATHAVEAARNAYVEKTKETETLETLKDKKREEHREGANRELRKAEDETVVQRYRFTKVKTGRKGGEHGR